MWYYIGMGKFLINEITQWLEVWNGSLRVSNNAWMVSESGLDVQNLIFIDTISDF